MPIATILGRMVTYVQGLLARKLHNPSRGLVRSLDKVKALYLHDHSAYDHETRQGGDLP